MWTRFAVAAHLSADDLAARYRAARDPVERSRWQMVWLLVSGRPLGDVAAVTGYSTRWIRAVVTAYNAQGPAALADQRHRNAGAAPLLDAAGRQALDEALLEPPSDGGLWTGRKVARWIAERLGRPPGAVPPKRGSVYLRRLDYTPRVPRPRHAKAADPAAQAAFQKRSTRRLQKNGRKHPTGSSSSGRKTSTGRA
jgi:Winged helix-turn helix